MPNKHLNVKTISAGGQISLGKKYAGRQVIVDQLEEGVWMVKTSVTIPENELWLWTEPFKSQLDQSLKATATRYANGQMPKIQSLDEIEAKLMAETREKVGNAS